MDIAVQDKSVSAAIIVKSKWRTYLILPCPESSAVLNPLTFNHLDQRRDRLFRCNHTLDFPCNIDVSHVPIHAIRQSAKRQIDTKAKQNKTRSE